MNTTINYIRNLKPCLPSYLGKCKSSSADNRCMCFISDTYNSNDNSTPVMPKSIDRCWIELTNYCNLRCSHCYTNSTRTQQYTYNTKPTDWHSVIKKVYNLGCIDIQFTGGEPTLEPELVNLLIYAKKIGFKNISVFSNAYSMPRLLFDTLAMHNIILCSSVYSSIATTHDSVTGVSGSFKKTMANIHQAIKLGINVQISIVYFHDLKNDIHRTKQFLKDLGISVVMTDFVRPVGRGRNKNSGNIHFSHDNGRLNNICIKPNGDILSCIMNRGKIYGNINSFFDQVNHD